MCGTTELKQNRCEKKLREPKRATQRLGDEIRKKYAQNGEPVIHLIVVRRLHFLNIERTREKLTADLTKWNDPREQTLEYSVLIWLASNEKRDQK